MKMENKCRRVSKKRPQLCFPFFSVLLMVHNLSGQSFTKPRRLCREGRGGEKAERLKTIEWWHFDLSAVVEILLYACKTRWFFLCPTYVTTRTVDSEIDFVSSFPFDLPFDSYGSFGKSSIINSHRKIRLASYELRGSSTRD